MTRDIVRGCVQTWDDVCVQIRASIFSTVTSAMSGAFYWRLPMQTACREREDLSGQWPARARYELFIVMRRTESEITFIFQHFSPQSHLSNRIVHLKTDNDVGHFVLREFKNVFELIHNSRPIKSFCVSKKL